MKQRFLNSSCFGDPNATTFFAVITFLHCETNVQKLTEFFDFINTSPIAFIAFYCKIRLALTYEILADPVTISLSCYYIFITKCFSSELYLGEKNHVMY